MMKERRRWVLGLVLLILSIVFTVLWWMVIQFYRDYQNIPSNPLIGNKPSTVAALKEQDFPFSFLVIGDTSGGEATETLIEMALREGTPSFMIILGDFVKNPDIWNHRFFLTEMASERRLPFPIYLVPGNHDIDYTGSKIKQKERRVTPEIYESLWGARKFDFTFNQCLFIISGVDLNHRSDYLSYLHDTLSKKGAGKRYIFVFIHYPPKGLADHIEGSLPIPNEEEFFSLLETFKVTTCFFGDYHGYWRGQRGGVNLIVSGGGGRLKRRQSEWGKFNHILRVTVDKGKVAEEIITVEGQIGVEDRFEEKIFTLLFPIIQNAFWILYFVFVVLLIGSGYAVSKLVRRLR